MADENFGASTADSDSAESILGEKHHEDQGSRSSYSTTLYHNLDAALGDLVQIVVQVSANSDDSEVERERVNSAVFSQTSSYSIAELHSAVELAAIDHDDDDDVWEQLSSLSSSNVNAVPLREEDPVLTKQELIRQIHLRRHVNQLKRNLVEKEGKVEELRY